MKTRSINLETTAGDTIAINVPTSLPTAERADYLRYLWERYVTLDTDHWKGPVRATVRRGLASDVGEAMEFMGGYWAHGF
jgi:hypothetical protein